MVWGVVCLQWYRVLFVYSGMGCCLCLVVWGVVCVQWYGVLFVYSGMGCCYP